MKRISMALAAMLTFTQNFASETGQSFAVERGLPAAQRTISANRSRLPHAPNPFALGQAADREQPQVPYRASEETLPRYQSPAVRLSDSSNGLGYVKLPGSNTVLTGAMVYNDLWGQTDENGSYTNPITAGFYSIQARPDGTITQHRLYSDLIHMRAGVKAGTIYYAISTYDNDETAKLTTYYASSWSQRSSSEIDVVNVPTDLCYDPVSGNTYGFFYNTDTQNYDRFCNFSLYYGEATDLYTIDRNGFAIACNSKGEIYGIMGYSGWLIRLYPDRASSPNGYGFEYIGKTGFSPSYINSMAFDDATGKLYWCANATDGYSALLEVNTTTGAATEIMHFENNATFAGIFAQPYKIPDAAPAAPEELSVNYTAQGAVTCTISAKAPSKSYYGGALSGNLTLVFSVDGADTAHVENVAPGAIATTAEITLAPGAHDVEVFAASDTYLGDTASASTWSGEDTPGKVTDLTLSDDDGRPTLSWTAPAEGLHGQWFNPDGLTYTITRYPDLHTVTGVTSTTWSDEPQTDMIALWYEVKAVNAMGESEPVSTAKMVFGDGFPIPFTERFETQADFDLWQVFDLNGGTTWVYNSTEKCATYSYGLEVEREGDDWLISPKFELKPGVRYALTFSAKNYYARYPENFRFCLGRSPQPEAMTDTICERQEFSHPTGYKDERVLFTVDEAGTYYLGVHCFSIAHDWTLFIDNIGILEVSQQVPSPVKDLTVTAAPQDALNATVALTAPDTYASGDPMTDPVKISLYCDSQEEPCKVWAEATPGQALTYEATVTESGTHTFRASVENAHGAGESREASTFIGRDILAPVNDLTISEAADGSVTIAWSAPTAGANGGYVETDGITYRIVRSIGAEVLAENLAETTFTDRTLNLTSQDLCYYLVYAIDKTGVRGAYANTPLNVVLGPALNAPVTETFAGAECSLYPWTDESNGSVRLWTIENAGINPACSDQNGDRGLAMCVSAQSTRGLTGYLLSPKISLSKLSAPRLSFWFYHSDSPAAAQGEKESLTVQISADHSEFTDIEGSGIQRDNGTAGWSHYTVDLTPWREAGFVRIAFAGKSMGFRSIYIDNISIDNAFADDLELTSVAGPKRIAKGVTADYQAIVSNLGASAAEGITLTTTLGGTQVAEPVTLTLAAGASERVTIPVTVPAAAEGDLTVTLSHASDSNEGNNSATCRVATVEPVLGAPDALVAETDNLTLTLSWTAPNHNPAVADDLESYEDFAINNIGDYTLVDRDWDNTYCISNDVTYPYMNDPKSFQLLNTSTLNIDQWDEGKAHSGNKVFGALSSINMPNDDWLISPRLNGSEQTVEFWAKSMTTDEISPERMRVLYSTGSTDPDDFLPLSAGDYVELSDSWEQFRYVLPEGARHFAINCVSSNSFVLMVDDLRFNDLTVLPQLPESYEVYRDGVVVATSASCSAFDTLPQPGTYRYKVRALYGDAGYTESPEYEVTVTATGIDATVSAAPVISAADGCLVVTGALGETVTVTLPDGRTINSATATADSLHMPLEPGVYVVTAGTSRATVLIH